MFCISRLCDVFERNIWCGGCKDPMTHVHAQKVKWLPILDAVGLAIIISCRHVSILYIFLSNLQEYQLYGEGELFPPCCEFVSETRFSIPTVLSIPEETGQPQLRQSHCTTRMWNMISSPATPTVCLEQKSENFQSRNVTLSMPSQSQK